MPTDLAATAGLIVLVAAVLVPFLVRDLERAHERTRRAGTATVRLTIDTRPFVEEMQRAARALAGVAPAMAAAASDMQRQLDAIRRALETRDEQWRASLFTALGIDPPEPGEDPGPEKPVI